MNDNKKDDEVEMVDVTDRINENLSDPVQRVLAKDIAAGIHEIVKELGNEFGPQYLSNFINNYTGTFSEGKTITLKHDDVHSIIVHVALVMMLASMTGLSVGLAKIDDEGEIDFARGETPPVVRQH